MPKTLNGRTLLGVLLAVVAAALVFSPSGPTPTSKVDDFRLLDHNGRSHWLGEHIDEDRIIFVAINHQCGTQDALQAMAKLQSDFPQAPAFYIAANPTQEREAFKTIIGGSNNKAPVLMDTSLTISRSLGLESAASATSVRPRDGLLTPLLKGLDDCQNPQPNGSELDYERDILPIIDDHCLACHTENRWVKIFKNYRAVRGWSQMIRQTLRTQRMPPGGYDPHVGAVEGGYTVKEMDMLLQWIEAGLPRSGDNDPLPQMNVDRIAVQNNPEDWGEPSVVWSMTTPDIIPAEGPDVYQYTQIAGPTPRDIYVSKIRMTANFKVAHHINLMVLDRPFSELTEEQVFKKGQDQFMRVRKINSKKGEMYHDHEHDPTIKVAHEIFEETILMTANRNKGLEMDFLVGPNRAIIIPKGSYLLLESHYGSSGKEESSTSKVLVFEHTEPKAAQIVERGCLYRGGFKIPPNKRRFTMKTAVDIEDDILLVRIAPHMHARGRSAKYIAHFPDGTTRVLLSIPYYQYKYQRGWEPKPHIFLPKGTRLETHVTYDNSKYNPINPDPTQWVYNGSSRAEEMHLPRFHFIRLNQEPK